MDSKMNEYGPAKSEIVKKRALRESQNDNTMVVENPRGPECPKSFSICNNQGPIVYARRKSEQESLPKKNTDSAHVDQSESTKKSEVQSFHESEEPNLDTANSQRRNEQHWKERFLRLQANLRSCDHSNRQEYIKMLQSLSSAGRSKHAVELERRAIQLLLDEGNELMRMKHLNVLGKYMPLNSVSPATQQFHKP